MKSIKLRVLLLLLYLVVLGVYLYPKGASLSDPAGVQWLAVMGGTLLASSCSSSCCATASDAVIMLSTAIIPRTKRIRRSANAFRSIV